MLNFSSLSLQKLLICILISVLAVFLLLLIFDNRLKTVHYVIETDKIEFPVRLALISDLHSCNYGKKQQKLESAIDKAAPDALLLCGDIFDDDMPHSGAEAFLEATADKYPAFYVTGNHEHRAKDYDEIINRIQSNGVHLLFGESIEFALGENGQRINICGISDIEAEFHNPELPSLLTQLENLENAEDNGLFTLLLSHRPELIEDYLCFGFDLVVSGHAHGGQWRIPGILNGLFAPNQGFFPKYAGGQYRFGDQSLIVSRGLAKESTLVPRVFNRPELVVLELRPKG